MGPRFDRRYDRHYSLSDMRVTIRSAISVLFQHGSLILMGVPDRDISPSGCFRIAQLSAADRIQLGLLVLFLCKL